jgi:hypothetical protein
VAFSAGGDAVRKSPEHFSAQPSHVVCGQLAIAEAIAILSDQSNREDRKKKEGFSFFKNAGLPVRVGFVLVDRGD